MKRLLGRLWAFVSAPPNLPRIAGFGMALMGVLLLAAGVAGSWWKVPLGFNAQGDLETMRSPIERPVKLFLLAVCGFWFLRAVLKKDRRHRWARAIALCAMTWIFGAVFFAHQLVVAGGCESDIAAQVTSEFDELTWLGGEIYTAREYEYIGGAEGLYLKDPPLLVARVPLPHGKLDLGALGDYSKWLGMTPVFWNFLRKTWILSVVGAGLLLLASLSMKPSSGGRALVGTLPGWLFSRLALASAVLVSVVALRVGLAESALSVARTAGEAGQFQAAVGALDRAVFWMPALASDSGLVFQRGRWELRNSLSGSSATRTPAARLYGAFLAEQRAHRSAALAGYESLFREENEVSEPVRSEAGRGLLRLGVSAYNSGQLTKAERLFDLVKSAGDARPKLLYADLLLAVQQGNRVDAELAVEQLREVLATLQKPEGRAAIASGRGHVAQLAFDDGDFDAAWESYLGRLSGK